MVTGFDEPASVPPAEEEPQPVNGGQTARESPASWTRSHGSFGAPPPGAPAPQPPRPKTTPTPTPTPTPEPSAAVPPTFYDEPVYAVTSPPAPASSPTAPTTSSATAPTTEPENRKPVRGPLPRTHPARMVLGMATIAAERLRGGAPASEALMTGVGLVQQGASDARDAARRVWQPASRVAAETIDFASRLPGAGWPLRSLARSRARFARVVAEARTRGEATVAAGRADAEAFVRSSVADTLSWAQAQAVPQIVDGLVPHLVDEVVPRILEGALPEIRASLMPAVIDDLTHSPQVRDLVLEQGRGAVGEAALHLRATTASADDRVESAFRRLVRAPAPEETDADAAGVQPDDGG